MARGSPLMEEEAAIGDVLAFETKLLLYPWGEPVR